jgi:hypothetical protein
MYMAVVTCGMDGKWGPRNSSGQLECLCVPKGGSAGAGGTPMAKCGNGVIEKPGEDCEGGNLMNATCASLGLGTGVLKCNPVICRYDTSGCAPPQL